MGELLARATRRPAVAHVRHVSPVAPRAAGGLVAAVYRQVERDFGMLAPPVSLHSPAPEVLAACWLMLRESLIASHPHATPDTAAPHPAGTATDPSGTPTAHSPDAAAPSRETAAALSPETHPAQSPETLPAHSRKTATAHSAGTATDPSGTPTARSAGTATGPSGTPTARSAGTATDPSGTGAAHVTTPRSAIAVAPASPGRPAPHPDRTAAAASTGQGAAAATTPGHTPGTAVAPSEAAATGQQAAATAPARTPNAAVAPSEAVASDRQAAATAPGHAPGAAVAAGQQPAATTTANAPNAAVAPGEAVAAGQQAAATTSAYTPGAAVAPSEAVASDRQAAATAPGNTPGTALAPSEAVATGQQAAATTTAHTPGAAAPGEAAATGHRAAATKAANAPAAPGHAPGAAVATGREPAAAVTLAPAHRIAVASREAKEAVAAAVSLANRCPYCVEVHGATLIGLVRNPDAIAIAEGHIDSVSDPGLRALARWAHGDGGPPPFGPELAPDFVGVAVTFHYLNRMVNLFLQDSLLPSGVPKSARRRINRMAARIMGALARDARRPGDSIQLLPEAPLPPDMAWALGAPGIADAFARAAAAIERAGERSVPDDVRALVQDWHGGSGHARYDQAETGAMGGTARAVSGQLPHPPGHQHREHCRPRHDGVARRGHRRHPVGAQRVPHSAVFAFDLLRQAR